MNFQIYNEIYNLELSIDSETHTRIQTILADLLHCDSKCLAWSSKEKLSFFFLDFSILI